MMDRIMFGCGGQRQGLEFSGVRLAETSENFTCSSTDHSTHSRTWWYPISASSSWN